MALRKSSIVLSAALVTLATAVPSIAQQVSRPVTLQWFESSWRNMERRMPDLFQAGYGSVWTPPPGRAIYLPEGGGIGYDPYDRFDLGKPRDPTLYGTEKQYIGAVRSVQKFGGNAYVDYVHHHLGSLDMNLNGQTYRQGVLNQGYAFPQFNNQVPYLADRSDYPGFEVSDPNNPIPAVVGGNPTASRDTFAELYGSNSGLVPFGDVFEYWFRLRGATEGGNLITVDLSSQNALNRQFVRNPVPGNPQNIRESGAAWNIPTSVVGPDGRVGSSQIVRRANVASEENRRFYPDQNGPSRIVRDNGVNYTVYDFNLSNPSAGDPVAESPIGYMMRYAQWMTQVVGVDGLRVDAARHVPLGVFNSAYNPTSMDVPKLIDRAIAGASSRNFLDGTKRNVIQFQEIFSYNGDQLASFVRKNQPAGDTVNPDRDVLDFSLWAAMATNMTGNGTQNNWFNIRSASMNSRVFGGTLDPNIVNNGANGIGFVYNHDEGVSPPGTGGTIVLDNVAHAWVLMRPGNAYVYYRSNEFDRTGNNQFFLKNARGDALGGTFGNIITTLVDVRNSYARGNFIERFIDNAFSAPQDQKSAIYVFERQGAAVVGLNIGYNPGATSRNINTSFVQGTRLEEVTGNWQDPSGQIPRVITVGAGGTATISIPWNNAGNGNKGYVIYGLPLPRGNMAVLNDLGQPITQILDETPTPGTNGTARISDIDVVTTDTFRVRLTTNAVTLADGFRDTFADGDRAMLRINEGFDANGNGSFDFPSSAASNETKYGFENFLTVNQPGFGSGTGNGLYEQVINAAALGEGYHHVTVRAWRKQGTNESEVFKDFRRTIYVDRLDPESVLDSADQLPYQSDNRVRDIRIKSLDATADSVHVLFDVPVTLSDAEILSRVSPSNVSTMIDRDLFGKIEGNVGSGLHTVVSVTYEPTGRYKIHRFAGVPIQTSRGLGMGDVNFDGGYSAGDVTAFETVLYSNRPSSGPYNPQFNAAGDLNGNGVIDTNDLFLLPGRYASVMNGPAFEEARNAVVRRGDFNASGGTNLDDLDALVNAVAGTSDLWLYDLSYNSSVDFDDINLMVRVVLDSQFGDLNLDGRVDQTDLNTFSANWGQSNRTWSSADLNGDDIVDLFDFFLLAPHWGWGVPGGLAPATVVLDGVTYSTLIPEPATLGVLFGVGVLGLSRRRRG
jgi:hypothetical protein